MEAQAGVVAPLAGDAANSAPGADGMCDRARALTAEELRTGLVSVLQGKDLDTVTPKTTRYELARSFGMADTALDARKSLISDLIKQVVQEACADLGWSGPGADGEDLGQEKPLHPKKVYLVTFSHPKESFAADGTALKAPGAYSREEVGKALLDAVEKTQGPRQTPLIVQQLSVFREKHGHGAVHYHVPLLAVRTFRFQPLKDILLHDYGLASHWSCSHDGYHSCLAYCYVPSLKKPATELDDPSAVYLWPNEEDNKHPPLAEASRQPYRAAAWAKRSEKARLARAEVAKPERFEAIDVWPVVVRENIMDTPAAPEVLMAYAKRCGGAAMVQFCFNQWTRLPELISRSWKVELVEDYIVHSQKSRLQILQDALSKPCTCAGQWLWMARDLFAKNELDEAAWRAAMLHSLEHGRSKGTLVCHAGHLGNEGKSFLFAGLEAVYGEDAVFTAPPKGAFPMLGLERCRLVLLDDWRFNEDIIGYPLQLLWFEGKPIVIARPQNQFSGHLRYSKDDPIFITTLLSDITKVKGKRVEGGDIAMMVKRLAVFEFKHQLEAPSKVPACASCFSKLLLQPSTDAQIGTPSPAGPETPRGGEAKRPLAERSGETPGPKAKCAAWSVEHVLQYLDTLGLHHISEKFSHNGIDGLFLQALSEEDLVQELGLTKLQARKILSRLP
jgi:hypothetical protein